MERLELQEIKKKYPDEWVLLIELETDESLNIRSGIVAAHSPKRTEIGEKLRQYDKRRAIYFTGEVAKDKIFAL